MSSRLGFSHNMAMIGCQWMLHKWQLVRSGGVNIFGLVKRVYNLTSVNTSETLCFFPFVGIQILAKFNKKIANVVKLTLEKKNSPNFFVKKW